MTTGWMTSVLVAVALVTAGCGGARQAESGAPPPDLGDAGQDLSGSITIDGSSTVFPVSQAAAERFQQQAPDVRIAVGFSGTGGGFKKFCNGETAISNASRPITPEEEQACSGNGVEFQQFRVGLDGITNAVSNDNDWAGCLTVEQLEAIWREDSEVDSWDDVEPSFPAAPLDLYGPGPDSGTFDFFVEEVLGEDARPRSDYTASEDDNVLVQGIAGSPNALGYFGFAYFVGNEGALRALGVDGGDGCVEPTAATIEDGSYPLSRPLFIYVSDGALDDEHVRAFVGYYLDNADALAEQAGYVAPSEQTLQDNLEAFESATG